MIDSEQFEPIRSTLIGDEDYADLVREFVGEIPSRIATICECLDGKDATLLKRAVHQLKGACGGYGFPTLTTAAAELELALNEASIDEVLPKIDAFVKLLGRVVSD